MTTLRPVGLSFEYEQADGHFYTCRVGELALIVWRDEPSMDDGPFEEHLAAFEQNFRTCGQFKAAINLAQGFNPNARQRGMVKEREPVLGIRDVERLALVTNSSLVRGAMLAIFWLVGNSNRMKPFSPLHTSDALSWCRDVATFDVELASSAIAYGLERVRPAYSRQVA